MWALLIALAVATEPRVHLEPDGTLVGEVVVDASVHAVRALLDDPSFPAGRSPDVLHVESRGRGDCRDVEIQTRGVFRPLRLLTRRCRTDSGWRESLVESESFTDYEVEWSAVSVDEGTAVTVHSLTQVDLPVPDQAVRSRERRSLLGLLRGLHP